MNRAKKLFYKTYVKYKHPSKYQEYKFLNKLSTAQIPFEPKEAKEFTSFKHSGNAGDIVYAIPAMIALAKDTPIHLHLHINQQTYFNQAYHPLGNVMLNEKMVQMLQPLILNQPQFAICDILCNQKIDYDLDKVREYPLLLDRGNIARWYFLIYPAYYNLQLPWLQVTPDTNVSDAIVIARSHRYRAPGIDYSFLKKYSKVYFVGVYNEFEDVRKMIPNIQYRPVNNFLEMASVIAGCKLFIGNQSFPFSIAEGLKVNRLLEVYYQSPNVTVYGNNGFDFCFQPQFEKLVQMRYDEL